MNGRMERKKVQCDVCGKNISSANIIKHKKTKHCLKHANDKTTGGLNSSGRTTAQKPLPPNNEVAVVPVVSHSKILTEINLKSEFDKNMEKLNPKKNTGKEKKYQCGVCNATFDNLNEGKCPDCGEQLQ